MAILKPGSVEFVSHSVEQTYRLGYRLGEMLRSGDVICLSGSLGAGKTAFARGVGRGWGAVPDVTSPTFTLVHEHTRERDDLRLYHVDSYRLSGPDDALTFGFEEMLIDEHPVLLEWPERVEDMLPADRLTINFVFDEADRRHLIFDAAGEHYEQFLEDFRKRTFGV